MCCDRDFELEYLLAVTIPFEIERSSNKAVLLVQNRAECSKRLSAYQFAYIKYLALEADIL
jgi:hypothetical protein